MSFENEAPKDLAQSVNQFFRAERSARLNKGETPLPKHFSSEDPNLRKAAEKEYLSAVLSKPASALTINEQKFLMRHAAQFLQHGDED